MRRRKHYHRIRNNQRTFKKTIVHAVYERRIFIVVAHIQIVSSRYVLHSYG
jgi:hypothetical protein